MTQFTTVQVPAQLPVRKLKEFAHANGFKLVCRREGGFMLVPCAAPAADYPAEVSNAQ